MNKIAYDQILSLPKLPNGIVFVRIKDGKPLFTANITCIADSTRGGAELINVFSDATNAHITLRTQFSAPVLLDSRETDSINIIVADDLSSLISFTSVVKGFTTALT